MGLALRRRRWVQVTNFAALAVLSGTLAGCTGSGGGGGASGETYTVTITGTSGTTTNTVQTHLVVQ